MAIGKPDNSTTPGTQPSKVNNLVPRWPSQVTYQDALQNPAFCFADPILRTCNPLDYAPFGLPTPISGQFANVYRMQSADGRVWGIKLFLRHLSSRTVQYRALQTHVMRIIPAPTWLVPFAYHESGIFINNNWFPVLQMPWLYDALPLNVYIGQVINDAAALRRLREAWRKLILDLQKDQFAHGDLQHGNILVRDGLDGRLPVLILLDYDGSWVPGLSGRVGTELGHPAYQHPARDATQFGPRMDRFSAVVIYTALLILARAPDLWYRFDNGDNILFRREDFVEVDAKGRAIYELAHHPNAFVRRAAEAFRTVCMSSPTLVPDLERFGLIAEMI